MLSCPALIVAVLASLSLSTFVAYCQVARSLWQVFRFSQLSQLQSVALVDVHSLLALFITTYDIQITIHEGVPCLFEPLL